MQRQKMEGEGTWGGSGKPPPFSVEIVWRLGYQEYDPKAELLCFDGEPKRCHLIVVGDQGLP
jgi:hypothetical protein